MRHVLHQGWLDERRGDNGVGLEKGGENLLESRADVAAAVEESGDEEKDEGAGRREGGEGGGEEEAEKSKEEEIREWNEMRSFLKEMPGWKEKG